MIRKLLFLISIVSFCHACCPDRGDFTSLDLDFIPRPPRTVLDSTFNFRQIYTLGGNRILYKDININSYAPYDNYYLPISYATNQTVYIFESTDRTDTLTIAYEPKVEFISRKCGGRLILTNIRVAEPTTFSNVTIDPKGYSINEINSTHRLTIAL